MALSFAGNGTITGLSVGGLPDGTVDEDTLANNAVGAGKLASGVGGKVLQVVGTVKTDTFTTTSASPTVAFSATITPSSTSSKVLVSGHFCMSSNQDANTPHLYRDSTEICIADAYGSSRKRGFIGSVKYEVGRTRQVSFSFLDSPSSTSALVYSVKIVANSSQTVYVGRSSTGGDDQWDGSGCSTMNLMEISA